ncbi:uncharacterized protein LOC131668554 [Phymastichus coffea]|uniref:uncharacterized protein LOC131668554 n=1 Tax=Phymastichus coffea TaxID=108790 RepID=UPI00273C0BA2|nr:uncharacterized protein LOC131668554 [Phymastichus coffea]
MRYDHGIKLSDIGSMPNFIRFMTENVKVDLTSKSADLVQVHEANTLEPEDDVAIVVNHSNLHKSIFINVNHYNKFFLHGYGYATTNSKSSEPLWENVTYVQAYLPEIHAYICRRPKRWGSVTGYVVAGGYSYLPMVLKQQNKSVKRLMSDAEGLISDYKCGIEVLTSSASLRIEQVKTFIGSTCLVDAQNSLEQSSFLTCGTKKFLDHGAYLASNWTRYMLQRTKKDFDFLEKIFIMVKTTAGNSVTRSLIEECYDCEQRLRFFFMGDWKNVPTARLTWLLENPREGWRGKNVREGAYIFRNWQNNKIPTLKERQRLRQPVIGLKLEYYRWPFLREAIAEMSQYYPEEESNLHTPMSNNLDLKIHYLITRLIGFSRLLHGFPYYSFKFIEHAFSKKVINAKILQQGCEIKAYISGVVPVSTLVRKILNPTTLIGKLIRSTVHISEPIRQ